MKSPSQPSRPRILVIHKGMRSFVREDIEILSENFSTTSYHFDTPKKPFSFFIEQIKACLFLFSHIKSFDVYYIWFCDYHAFTSVLMSRLLRKKSIIVVGGFDAVSIPSISYGLFLRKNARSKLAKWAYEKADQIITVNESLIESSNTYAGEDSTTGVLQFVPSVASKIKAIPTGYDDQKWKCNSTKKHQVLTVASVLDSQVFLRKGIDLFFSCAKQMPETNFVLIGLKDESLIPTELQHLNNVEIIPELPQEQLISYYSDSKVYAQFSVSEGLPNVLCEAMLSECIPVGSTANGIPLAIGDTGFLIDQKDVTQAIVALQKALSSQEDLGKKARKRIQKLFPKDRRREELTSLLRKL